MNRDWKIEESFDNAAIVSERLEVRIKKSKLNDELASNRDLPTPQNGQKFVELEARALSRPAL